MSDTPQNPVSGAVSRTASKRAMEVGTRLLDDIAQEPEWEKVIGLVVGNLAGHAYIMIRRHVGVEAADQWLKTVETIRADHIRKDTPKGS